MSFVALLAMITLAMASVVALLSTQRAKPSYLRGNVGWVLASVLAIAAVFLFMQQWGVAVAVSAALLALMAGIPLASTVIGRRQRQEPRHGG